MARSDTPRIAVLGAGPIGLEAALYARSLQLPVTVYERARVGEHLRRWGHVRLFSPFGMNVTPLGRAALLADNARRDFPADADCVTGREHVARYLEPLAQSAGKSRREFSARRVLRPSGVTFMPNGLKRRTWPQRRRCSPTRPRS